MPLDFHRFAQVRPYLYHLTARENLASIERGRALRSAGFLLAEAGYQHLASVRRQEQVSIAVKGSRVLIRDQAPLAAGSIEFEEGWSISQLVRYINQQVFLWPGTAIGPVRAGANHFTRYCSEQPVIIRIKTDEVAPTLLRYSMYNSGAPRCSGGKRSPRGSRTFLSSAAFSRTPSDVVEVVAEGSLMLPPTYELADQPTGPWRKSTASE